MPPPPPPPSGGLGMHDPGTIDLGVGFYKFAPRSVLNREHTSSGSSASITDSDERAQQLEEWASLFFDDDEATTSMTAMTVTRHAVGPGGCDDVFVLGNHEVTLIAAPGHAIGMKVWRGSLRLSRELERRSGALFGLRGGGVLCDVLELGCGRGLCGLHAHAFGAKVTMTDCSFKSLAGLLPSVVLARGAVTAESWGAESSKLCVRRHLWESDEPRSPGRGPPRHWSSAVDCEFGPEGQPPELEEGGTYDVVLASDCLYFHSQVGSLLTTIARRLRPGGVALLSYIPRHHPAVITELLDRAADFGLELVSATEPAAHPLDEARGSETNNGRDSPVLIVELRSQIIW